MIVDTSALLAIYFKEKHGAWAKDVLKENVQGLKMSTVNLAETLVKLQDRQPNIFDKLRESLFELGIEFIPPTEEQAVLAAKAKFEYPLNFGDCFAYALAKIENEPIITLDSDFAKTDLQVVTV